MRELDIRNTNEKSDSVDLKDSGNSSLAELIDLLSIKTLLKRKCNLYPPTFERGITYQLPPLVFRNIFSIFERKFSNHDSKLSYARPLDYYSRVPEALVELSRIVEY